MFPDLANTSLKNKLFSSLIAIFPISFIAGNLIINLNILLLLLGCLFFFGAEIFEFKIKKIDKLIVLIFLYIFIVGIFNNLELNFFSENTNKDFILLKKSFLYLRYLLLYLVIRFLIEKKIINLKLFFLISLLCSVFVCLDLFYQFKFGRDIFGFEQIGRKFPGPFGDEAIAGGYLQRFSIIGMFFIYLFSSLKFKTNYILIFLLFFIFLIGIVISGNRMPLILFLFSIFLVLIFDHKLRKHIITIFFVALVTIFLLTKISPVINQNLANFVKQITWSYKYLSLPEEIKKTKKLYPRYLYEFSTFYETWKMNKFLGGGIKSFRKNCINRDNVIEKWRHVSCNIHPHNYYLEIFTELGLFGFFLIFFFLYKLIFAKIKENNYFTLDNKSNLYLAPFLIILITEMFPLRSSGSFFTTNNSAFMFLVIAIVVSLMKKKY